MVGLSVFNAVISYILTENNYLFSQVLIITFLSQLLLVFALGKVNTRADKYLINNESEFIRLKEQVEVYKRLANESYVYAGNYPVWKAQQEFRQLMNENNITLTDGYLRQPFTHPTKAEQIDFYLSRIVNAFSIEINKGTQIDFVSNDMFWSSSELSEARGDNLLNKIVNQKSKIKKEN